jgi:2-polyprenyl-3-methyl-5-hydroxy-6-metoxy-1,4-benzoquinol methylase
VLLKGGETVKSLSTAFLADLEEDWRHHGKEIFPILRAKYPQAYFQGIVSLARIIRWDVDPTDAFDRTLSPEEIMDKLEERVGPKLGQSNYRCRTIAPGRCPYFTSGASLS